jgi:gas vesicle structural protein
MTLKRSPAGESVIDVLDHVLDKGIVIDAWVRVSLVGIDLITLEARVVVASIDTYRKHTGAISQLPSIARPMLTVIAPPNATTITGSRRSIPRV